MSRSIEVVGEKKGECAHTFGGVGILWWRTGEAIGILRRRLEVRLSMAVFTDGRIVADDDRDGEGI